MSVYEIYEYQEGIKSSFGLYKSYESACYYANSLFHGPDSTFEEFMTGSYCCYYGKILGKFHCIYVCEIRVFE